MRQVQSTIAVEGALSRNLLSYDIKPLERRPHLLDVIEGPYFGSEYVHEHISGIDNDPVRIGEAFDTDVLNAAHFQFLFQFLGKGADMAGGCT